MIIHELHDLSSEKVVSILRQGLSKISDEKLAVNYHPDYSDDHANLFYILATGRYRKGYGKYYVLEDNGKYVSSAGWNEYDQDPTIAFALTRMYTDPEYRSQYLIAQHVLPNTLKETSRYDRVWLTVNEHNKLMYNWFVRASQNKRTALFNDWPEIYRNFKPIGEKIIYNTPQYVVELKRNKMTDQEKIDFLSNAIRTLFGKEPKGELTPDSNLTDLGLDSLDVVELQMHYEETTGIETSADSRVATVRDLMALMQ